MLRPRRVLLSVSNKDQLAELGHAFAKAGAELVATGKTAQVLVDAGLSVVPIEKITGNPEAFQGRMKTLSFQVGSGLLYRRGDEKDEADLKKLGLLPIDAVVINFYPFEKAAEKMDLLQDARALHEEIDIGGPTWVRAAAKSVPDCLVLTDPKQYPQVILELNRTNGVEESTIRQAALEAWRRVADYDSAIERKLRGCETLTLRYGENPHQTASMQVDPNSPIAWPVGSEKPLTDQALSYNNVLDMTAAYDLTQELHRGFPGRTGVVIVKHGNPCGVAWINRAEPQSQLKALQAAWEGDPVSAFGGVLCFSDPLTQESAEWLAPRFVELVAAPGLASGSKELNALLRSRKKLKALSLRRIEPWADQLVTAIPGGRLMQSPDSGGEEELKSVTKKTFPEEFRSLTSFGIAVTRCLRSNAIALVRELPEKRGYQLIGAGQGQPNRIDAIQILAIPRAKKTLKESQWPGDLKQSLLISDAFFPFADSIQVCAEAGIAWIVQPGGSIKDSEVIAECDQRGLGMMMSGRRHFKH